MILKITSNAIKKIIVVKLLLLFFQLLGVVIRDLMDSVFIYLSTVFMAVVIKTLGFISVVPSYIHLLCMY